MMTTTMSTVALGARAMARRGGVRAVAHATRTTTLCGRRRTMVTTTTMASRRGDAMTTSAKKGFLFSEVEDVRQGGGADGARASGKQSVVWSGPLSVQKYPAPCLRAKNAPVEVFDEALERLSKEMFKVMYETVGCGLAAPQVGVNYRMMVYNEAGEPGRGKEVVLCNPKIVKFSKEKDLFEEGCLSFPKMYADVERPIGVQIEAQSVTGKKFKMTLEGFEARVFQHEYDHLDGVLYHDRMTPEVRAEVQSYLDSYVEAYEGDDKAL